MAFLAKVFKKFKWVRTGMNERMNTLKVLQRSLAYYGGELTVIIREELHIQSELEDR